MSAVKNSETPKPSRRERAKATQSRIVKAAYALFCDRGYAGTSMAMIAEAAGVAVQTVYFAFHTKASLLSRAYDYAVTGEEPLDPHQQPWFVAMTAEPNVVKALRLVVTGVGEIMRRVTPLYLVARTAADGDPDTARVMDLHERWRADGYCEMVELLTAKAALRQELSLDRATDRLLLFAGMDVYHVLIDGRGWSHDEWVDWTVATLTEQLFGPTRGSRS